MITAHWLVLLAVCSPMIHAQEKPTILNTLGLSAPTRKAMQVHMRKLQAYMQAFPEMVSRGQWNELKQKGDSMAKINLLWKDAVPPPAGFKRYAEELRDGAEELSNAAGKANGGGVLTNYYRMLASCMKCHANYAPNYFERRKDYVPPKDMSVKQYKFPYDWR